MTKSDCTWSPLSPNGLDHWGIGPKLVMKFRHPAFTISLKPRKTKSKSALKHPAFKYRPRSFFWRFLGVNFLRYTLATILIFVSQFPASLSWKLSNSYQLCEECVFYFVETWIIHVPKKFHIEKETIKAKMSIWNSLLEASSVWFEKTNFQRERQIQVPSYIQYNSSGVFL